MTEWKKSSLGELANAKGCVIQTGPFGSQLHKGEYQQEEVGVINPTHIKNRSVSHDSVPHVSGEVAERLAKHKVSSGDLLFARRGEIGRHALVKDSEHGWLCGTGCFLVRLNQEVADPSFVSCFLSTDDSLEWPNRHASDVVMPNLSNQVLQKAPLQVPCLAKQQEITRILSTVERATEAQERIIQTTTELKQALMQKLFSEGLRGEPQKMTEIGLVPESWDVKRFDSFAGLQRGFDITKKDQRGGKYPVVSSGGVSSYHIEARVKRPGVVIGHKGSLGTAHYIPSDYWPHDTTLWVKDFKGNDPQFAAYLLETIKLKRFDTGAANPTLNRNIVHGEKIPIPPTDQQGDNGKAVKAVEEKIRVHENHKHSLQHLLSTLLHVLVTAKMRVFSIKCRMIC